MNKINLTSLASLLAAWKSTSGDSTRQSFYSDYELKIMEILKDLPSGSGIEDTEMDWDSSNPKVGEQKIVFLHTFHHMKDGMYDGYTNHKIIVRPIFCGFDCIVRGSNRDGIREYLEQVWIDTFEI